MTPTEVFAEIETRISADPDKTKADLDGIFKFDVAGDDGGIWIVDCREVKVTKGEGEADVTIALSAEDLVQSSEDPSHAMTAFMMGKIQVEGDMGLAMKLQEILG